MRAVCGDPRHVSWVRSFVFAGSSAFLLLAVKLHPSIWCISFFLLTPFLYRVARATPGEAIRLGFLLGVSYGGALLSGSLVADPLHGTIRLAGTAMPFVLFSCAIVLLRRRWGFNPLLVAFLWTAFQLIFIRLGFAFHLLPEATFSRPLLRSAGILLGFVGVSFFIVLINSFLVLIVDRSLEGRRRTEDFPSEDGTLWVGGPSSKILAGRAFLITEYRGPPCRPLYHGSSDMTAFSVTSCFNSRG